MKLIHLSDLHLGKRVNEFSMIEDQKYILNQILGIIDEEQPDGILLAGDLYDRPVPSAEAVQLLDSFLTRLAKRKIPVYAISGNHDSAERIAFGSHIMSSSGICMSPVYDGKTAKYCLMDSYGEVWIHLLPFIRPAVVRHVFAGEEGAEEIRTYQEAVQAAVEHMDLDTEKRNVLVAHQFVVGAMSCDSEEITVGGIDQIEGAVFRDFDYVALGHISGFCHRLPLIRVYQLCLCFPESQSCTSFLRCHIFRTAKNLIFFSLIGKNKLHKSLCFNVCIFAAEHGRISYLAACLAVKCKSDGIKYRSFSSSCITGDQIKPTLTKPGKINLCFICIRPEGTDRQFFRSQNLTSPSFLISSSENFLCSSFIG